MHMPWPGSEDAISVMFRWSRAKASREPAPRETKMESVSLEPGSRDAAS